MQFDQTMVGAMAAMAAAQSSFMGATTRTTFGLASRRAGICYLRAS